MVQLLSMTWRDVCFAHWPVDPDRVRPRLPDGLALDTHDGRAWLGVVPFEMTRIGPRFSPVSLSFPELNLRTYVRGEDGTPGVYFFNLDADDRVGVPLARGLFRLPYYRARMRVTRGPAGVRLRSHRVHEGVPPADFDATYGPTGEPFAASEGSLPAFLTERYRFYAAGEAVGGEPGTLYYGDIAHEPWRLYEAHADLRENDLFAANGFDHPGGDPHLLYSPGIDVTAGRLHRVG